MTANQIIKKITKAGIDTTFITKHSSQEIEINANDYDTTEEISDKVLAVLPLSGFKTGYGSWILREGKGLDMGDWNDKSSRWHY